MAYTTPNQFSHGETMTARRINPELVDNMPALYNRLVHEVAYNYSGNDWTMTTASGAFQTDTSGCTITLSLEQTSTVIVLITVRWYSDTARDLSAAFRVENTTDSTYSNSVLHVGTDNAGCCNIATVIGVFTSVGPGNKIFRLNGGRYSSGDTVVVSDRIIAGVAFSAT